MKLSGGFVEYGEDRRCGYRELLEETGVVGKYPLSLTILGKPNRGLKTLHWTL